MPQIEHERAEDEAAEWLVLLAEDPENATLQAGFEAWHSAHPRHAEIWARTRRAYDLAGPALRKPVLQMIPDPAPRRRLAIRVAALALAAAIAIALTPSVLLRLQADVTTASAETRALDLADGSQLRLAPQSAVSVAVTAEGRQVRLLKGRAFFEVTPDPARPFTVQAGDTRVTVVGTAFEVRRGGNGTAIAVSHGRVRVENAKLPPEGELLGIGDAISVTDAGAERHRVDAAELADWRSGRLTVRDAAIAEVIDELRPYFAGYIFVADDAFSRQRVSGIYDLTDPVSTLHRLVESHRGQIHQVSPWFIQIQK
ncbi:MAG: FecR family protein [Ferrovibrio sp.]|uniref:FecR family protein n=1 Tax=Ferrovibrio sp. TaxID=1917215 RepID=UPI00391AB479